MNFDFEIYLTVYKSGNLFLYMTKVHMFLSCMKNILLIFKIRAKQSVITGLT